MKNDKSVFLLFQQKDAYHKYIKSCPGLVTECTIYIRKETRIQYQ